MAATCPDRNNMTLHEDKVIRVGVVPLSWGGGAELVRYVLNALVVIDKKESIEVFLLIPGGKNIRSVKDKVIRFINKKNKEKLGSIRRLFTYKKSAMCGEALNDSFKNLSASKKVSTVFYEDSAAGFNRRLKEANINVVFFNHEYRSDIPSIRYLADLQHKHYPHFFSKQEIAERDQYYEQVLADGTGIGLVGSADTRNDIQKYFPNYQARLFVMPFMATFSDEWFSYFEEDLSDKYNLPEKYFIICNQFWRHKDHQAAFKALSILVNKYRVMDVHMVCTGNTSDYRAADHFNNLKREISELGLESNVHILGHIPKQDQINIMKKAVCLIQPSLFEGDPGGYSLCDAVSIGQAALISDIPVNMEIKDKEANIFYFTAGDAADLASKMYDIVNKKLEYPGKDELRSTSERKIKALSDVLLGVVKAAVQNSHYEK